MVEEQDKLQTMRDRIRELHGQKKIALVDIDKFLAEATEVQMKDLLDRFDKDKDSVTEQQKADLKKLIDEGKIKLAEGESFDEYLRKLSKDSARALIKKNTKPPEDKTKTLAKREERPPEALSEFDRMDEAQIADMIEGRVVDDFIYEITISGRKVEGISYLGTIDAGKFYSERQVKKGNKPLEVIDYVLMETDASFRAFVRVREPESSMIISGYASSPKQYKHWLDKEHTEWEMKDDDKADVKAVSKATRNGIRNALPPQLIHAYIKALREGNRK